MDIRGYPIKIMSTYTKPCDGYKVEKWRTSVTDDNISIGSVLEAWNDKNTRGGAFRQLFSEHLAGQASAVNVTCH